jgi:putative DNA primase/helicase
VVGEKQLSLVQEVFGCCLLRDHPYHAAFMLVGDGKNGKTTLQNLLNAFLGKENVSHETLQELCYNRFSKAQLYGKLANTCADIPDTPLTQTGTFKMLTGNDPISAEYKFKNPFTFTNHAKLIFSCNKVPETKDDTDAYFRRWKIIPCNNVFTGEKCDPKILDKLTTPQELSGLFHWALEGLKRLIEKGEFSGNEDIEEQRRQYIRKSNSSKAYIEERLQYDPNDKAIIPEAELYQKYIQFCNENGLPTSKKAILTQNIQQYLPKARQTTARIDEKAGVHIWQHIRLVASVASVAGEYTKEGNDLPEFLDLSGRVATPATKVLHVPPAEPCEACHSLAVEWELVSENGIMRVCNSCFNQLRKRGKPFEFLEDDDES